MLIFFLGVLGKITRNSVEVDHMQADERLEIRRRYIYLAGLYSEVYNLSAANSETSQPVAAQLNHFPGHYYA
jgi:hypothetical protein